MTANQASQDPNDINVIIEISQGADPVKYEHDKESGQLQVDRFIATAMHYPANYGYMINSLAGDGDPLDVVVISEYPIAPGAKVRCRPVGVLLMEDDGGPDEKILAVPHHKLTTYYDKIESYQDLPQVLLNKIEHFFARYKDLEPGKWAKIIGWADRKQAHSKITAARN